MEFISKELIQTKSATNSDENVVVQSTEDRDRFVLCEDCDLLIDCYKDNINIIYIGDQYNRDETILCTACIQDKGDDLRQQGYKCDEWDEEEEEENTKIYHLTADYKKSTYQTEQWNNVLSNGKHVRFEITNYFYWGTFEIELTDKQKEEILKKNSIILNDHSGVSVESLDSGCDYSDEICNIDSFTQEECKEIHRLLYFDANDEESYQTERDDSIGVDTDILEQNGWSMDETIYGMDTGCELECVSD